MSRRQSIGLQGCLSNMWPLIAERDRVGRNFGVGVRWSGVEGRYLAPGQERGPLGAPVSWELPTPDGWRRTTHFDRPGGASIYWTPSTGAHEVYGRIRARWTQQGWERGPLGYPVSGEYAVPGGRQSDVEGGSIRWDSARRVAEILPR